MAETDYVPRVVGFGTSVPPKVLKNEIEKGKYTVPAVQGTQNSFVGCSELTK